MRLNNNLTLIPHPVFPLLVIIFFQYEQYLYCPIDSTNDSPDGVWPEFDVNRYTKVGAQNRQNLAHG